MRPPPPWSRALALVFGAVLLGAGACQPGALGGLGGAACPALGASVDPLSFTYSANARADAKVKAFVLAARELSQVAFQMEAMVTDACSRIAFDLGASPGEVAATERGPGEGARRACYAATSRIDWIIRQGFQVAVRVTPPVCTANLAARARCDGGCSGSVDPGQVVASCEPGRLSGYCQGRCTGRCEGQCQGSCQGQCSHTDASGRCLGQCQGTCDGTCSATCHARCEGTWQSPRCEGQVTGPSVDAECRASCDASASFNAQCTPTAVEVNTFSQNELAQRLVATLRVHLPVLIHAQLALGRRLAVDVRNVVEVGRQLPRVMGEAGAQAAACVAASAQLALEASARVDVSFQASASVSGRVGAGG